MKFLWYTDPFEYPWLPSNVVSWSSNGNYVLAVTHGVLNSDYIYGYRVYVANPHEDENDHHTLVAEQPPMYRRMTDAQSLAATWLARRIAARKLLEGAIMRQEGLKLLREYASGDPAVDLTKDVYDTTARVLVQRRLTRPRNSQSFLLVFSHDVEQLLHEFGADGLPTIQVE